MVQVYHEPLCRRHYASFASLAAAFPGLIRVLAVVLAFLLAFATGGFWKKISHDVVQPTVHYSGDALMVLESLTPGQEQVWTTSPALRAVLTSNSLSASVQVGEEDYNFDGKPDMIRFVASVQSPIPVHSMKLLLQFSYATQGAARLKMYGLAYITAASPLPGSSFSADGQLLLHQLAPLPASSFTAALQKPLLDSSALLDGSAVQGDVVLQLSSLLSNYQQHNITTVFDNRYPVWKAGSSQEFVVDAKIRIPPNQVHSYRPSTSEMLKWGWVQFACALWPVWWLLRWLERLVFGHRVLETRVVADLQPQKQRY
ncbi:hypothetical protein OEZ86_003518 [Tetradesmus obliquus]|nr:hypothetical protein OEZ86_003518 [Tetradesmus obliquus]